MVRAPFHEKIGNIEFDILIMPKMSFGTAHHETTRLMVRYLLEMNLDGKACWIWVVATGGADWQYWLHERGISCGSNR
jgi:hypothetical protein